MHYLRVKRKVAEIPSRCLYRFWEGVISQERFRWLARPKRRLSDSYFLVEEPAKAAARPREIRRDE
jgi:hypothetical protein